MLWTPWQEGADRHLLVADLALAPVEVLLVGRHHLVAGRRTGPCAPCPSWQRAHVFGTCALLTELTRSDLGRMACALWHIGAERHALVALAASCRECSQRTRRSAWMAARSRRSAPPAESAAGPPPAGNRPAGPLAWAAGSMRADRRGCRGRPGSSVVLAWIELKKRSGIDEQLAGPASAVLTTKCGLLWQTRQSDASSAPANPLRTATRRSTILGSSVVVALLWACRPGRLRAGRPQAAAGGAGAAGGPKPLGIFSWHIGRT